MNPSTAAARALVDELVLQGVQHAVLAPGSRSAPLAFALVPAAHRGEIRLHVRIDERVAAFTALGMARVSGPTAVVTTSGTAVANLHPAVLEAAHAGVPLILLTADRPHELRGTGANQTTDQVRVFGAAVRFFVDIPAAHGRAGEEADVRNVLSRAAAAATGARTGEPGPVHLNVAFREPLVPADDAAGDELDQSGHTRVCPTHPAAGLPDDGARRGVGSRAQSERAGALTLLRDRRTVVIAGDGAGPQARRLAEDGGFPLLAEPSSGARSGPNAVGPCRLLLGHARFGGRVERAVVFGHPTLSRPVGELLARRDVDVVVVAPGGAWPDAGRNAAQVASAVEVADDPADDGWLKEWQEADQIAQLSIAGVLEDGPLCGPLVARELWALLRPDDALVVGSSNPVRDLDVAAVPRRDDGLGVAAAVAPRAGAGTGTDVHANGGPLVVANRGLAGIDGTLSTAAGVSLASGRFTRVLLGDLAFLHDAGGLLVGDLEEAPDLQIVVVNDRGGGVFSLVEQGAPEYSDFFERVFGTPHAADLAALCAGYGVGHVLVDDIGQLRRALADAAPGRRVIEVRTERAGLRDLHARLRAAVDAALSP